MKLVYIAGPYRAATPWLVEKNIRNAEQLAFSVWRIPGLAALCPHTNTRFFDKSWDDRSFLDGTLEMMRRCDAVVVVPGWGRSSGTAAEIKEANELGIPVFFDRASLRDWAKAVSA